LTDVRKQKNVGADAVNQHGRYYELKRTWAVAGLGGSRTQRILRARDEEERFVLAVVAGLEEGFNTEVRLVANPLRRLQWEPVVDMEVSGLLTTTWSPDTLGDAE